MKEKENLESILPLQHSISINLSTIEKEIQALQNNGLVTPEESSYWYNTRDEALDALVQMVLDRSHLHFTRSTVVDSETVSWNVREEAERITNMEALEKEEREWEQRQKDLDDHYSSYRG